MQTLVRQTLASNDVKPCCCCCGGKNGEKLYILAAAQVGPLIIAKQLAVAAASWEVAHFGLAGEGCPRGIGLIPQAPYLCACP